MTQKDFDNLFEHGVRLFNHRLYHAALECWEEAIQLPCSHTDKLGQLYNFIGRVYFSLGDYNNALDHFTKAIPYASLSDTQAQYRMNQAMCYRLSNSDMAQRLLLEIADDLEPELPPYRLMLLYANLGSILCYNEFYADGLSYLKRSLQLCESNRFPHRPILYNNLGVVYLDVGEYSSAESCLLKALNQNGRGFLPTITELGRLYIERGEFEKSLTYAQMAFPLVWSSVMNYQRDEIANLFRLLANIAVFKGNRAFAIRLMEKALMLFGQAQMWKSWRQTQEVLDAWMDSPSFDNAVDTSTGLRVFDDAHSFVRMFDALNAQEIIAPHFSTLLDTRVMYADIIAQRMGMTEEERRNLIYACRFADYGLTALELDVLNNPRRSDSAWKHYCQHPLIGVQMLESVHQNESVATMIAHHHERFDGTGYPNGISQEDIPLGARILAVADAYAIGVVQDKKSHSHVIDEIFKQSGKAFDPEVVKCFLEAVYVPMAAV